MSYDELGLDTLRDERTALFFLISDTDTTYNFIVALAFSQMFNLLCERVDSKYGGRHPVKGSEPDLILPGHEPVQGAL